MYLMQAGPRPQLAESSSRSTRFTCMFAEHALRFPVSTPWCRPLSLASAAPHASPFAGVQWPRPRAKHEERPFRPATGRLTSKNAAPPLQQQQCAARGMSGCITNNEPTKQPCQVDGAERRDSAATPAATAAVLKTQTLRVTQGACFRARSASREHLELPDHRSALQAAAPFKRHHDGSGADAAAVPRQSAVQAARSAQVHQAPCLPCRPSARR